MSQAQARVQIINETPRKHEGEWQLRLQWCRYLYPNGRMQYGYRFIWVRSDGTLQATRGQTRIGSFAQIEHLFAAARSEGWGSYNGDLMT
jgi:hypothetical protein